VTSLFALATASLGLSLGAQAVLSGRQTHGWRLLLLVWIPLCAIPYCLLLLAVESAKGAAWAAGLITLAVGGRILYLASQARLGRSLPRNATASSRLAAAMLAIAIILGSGAGVTRLNRHSSANAAAVSAVGSAVNAISGEVEDNPAIAAPTNAAYIDGGDDLRVCNLSTEPQCVFRSPPRPMIVHNDDVLWFKILLHNSGWRPVPYAKFFVEAGPHIGVKLPGIGVSLEIAWPRTNSLNEAERPDITVVALRPYMSGVTPSLHYISGSTVLEGLHDQLITRLPDGIMGPAGIALTDIGAPASCFECNMQYVRFIAFRARAAVAF
jgi:hypothetical protein